jgi:pimeloyl-ACP methyl ester carboxylesterase
LPSGATDIERFEHGGAALVAEVMSMAAGAPHLVFLHGWGVNRESLRGIAVLFQRDYTVHLIDLPGFGEAAPPPDTWDTIHYADLVQQYLLDRIAGPAILIGHSFGGRVTVRLAARHLPQIKGIVLMGVPGLPAPALSRNRIRRGAIRSLRRFLNALKPITGPGPLAWHTQRFGSRDYLAAGVMRSVFVRVVNEDLTESASTIACPALLIWGSDDTESPVWLARRYAELVDGHATLALLPHKDHHLYAGTGAHLCAFRIKEWLPQA